MIDVLIVDSFEFIGHLTVTVTVKIRYVNVFGSEGLKGNQSSIYDGSRIIMAPPLASGDSDADSVDIRRLRFT